MDLISVSDLVFAISAVGVFARNMQIYEKLSKPSYYKGSTFLSDFISSQ